MASPDRPLWPRRATRRWLQLGFALIAAPLTLAAALTLIAFAVYGISEPVLALSYRRTSDAAQAMLVFLGPFTLSLGLAGVALLWWLGWRRRGAWLATGAGAGALFALATGLISGAGARPGFMLVAALLGLAQFALVRWYAGIRAG